MQSLQVATQFGPVHAIGPQQTLAYGGTCDGHVLVSLTSPSTIVPPSV